MMTFAKRATVLAAAGVILVAGSVSAETAAVSKIEVDTSYLAAEGGNVMTYYPELADDVEARIRAMVPPSDDPTGPTLRVDLREISLDGSFALPDTKEFNKLAGVMSFSNGSDSVTVPVSVSAEAEPAVSVDGQIVIQPSTSDFYNAMVDGFAGAVVEAIPD